MPHPAPTIESDHARLYERIDRSGGVDACWPWTGRCQPPPGLPYGQFWLRGRTQLAHRVAYEFVHGDIPYGMLVCHSCDNPRCCNDGHLFLGTHQDNSDDMKTKGRDRPPPNMIKLHPEYAARGDRHSSKTHPELVAKGEDHPHAKLTEDQVREIRRLHASGVPQNRIADQFPCTKKNINIIVLRKTWRHLV